MSLDSLKASEAPTIACSGTVERCVTYRCENDRKEGGGPQRFDKGRRASVPRIPGFHKPQVNATSRRNIMWEEITRSVVPKSTHSTYCMENWHKRHAKCARGPTPFHEKIRVILAKFLITFQSGACCCWGVLLLGRAAAEARCCCLLLLLLGRATTAATGRVAAGIGCCWGGLRVSLRFARSLRRFDCVPSGLACVPFGLNARRMFHELNFLLRNIFIVGDTFGQKTSSSYK